MQRAGPEVDFQTNDNYPQPQQQTMGSIAMAHHHLPQMNSSLLHATSQENNNSHHDLPRPYKCPMCTKAFHRLEHQTRHIRTHTGEKPHACQFPGCSKRFSRSDELTRHSRIHNNPNSRRSNNSHHNHASRPHSHAVAALQTYAQDQAISSTLMPPPPSHHRVGMTTQSAPTSQLGSPNVSPPNSFTSAYLHPSRSSPHHSPISISLLASAASAVERDAHSASHLSVQQVPQLSSHSSTSSSNSNTPSLRHHPYRLPSLSHYAFSARSSRHGSPNSSTAPSSPTFSHDDSLSPTDTPLATPSHSPRLRPWGLGEKMGVTLPGLRGLSIQQQQVHQQAYQGLAQNPYQSQQQGHGLQALEPSTAAVGSETGSPYGSLGAQMGMRGGEGRLSDILNKEGEERRLPKPKIQIMELLNPR